jgi:uncharacterized membrane protein
MFFESATMLAARRRAAVTATLGLFGISVLITLLVAFIIAPKVVWFAGLYIVLAVCAIPIWFLLYCGASSTAGTEGPKAVPSRFQVFGDSVSIGPLRPRPLR